jgi:hypothetical protein
LDDDSISETGKMLFEFVVPHVNVAKVEVGASGIFHGKDLITPRFVF